jgi:signal transduction histidine kinase
VQQAMNARGAGKRRGAAPTVGGPPARARERPGAILEGQNRILERIANNDPLDQILAAIALLCEAQAPDTLCSILLLEGDTLHHGAAPSLPAPYVGAIDGTHIGPSVGSCGTAAFRKQPVIVTDIETDPLWASYKHLALPHGLRACWSTPILSHEDAVLGTFAIYRRAARPPTSTDLRLVEVATHMARIAIERDAANEAMRSRAAQLTAESKRKDEFLALLAHELRNPLAPMLSALELMRLQSDKAEAVAAYREVMDRQVRHLGRLVDDLLDVSRITHGKLGIQRQRTTLDALVSQAIEQATPLVARRRVALRLALSSPPIELDVDPVRMVQVLVNLLNNAAKFSAHGGEILITAERDGATAVVRVRDRGVGMTPETLARAFEPFEQGERAGETTEAGIGIGLALVERIVALHGGQVTATSEGPGKGSELIVRVPMAAAQGEER